MLQKISNLMNDKIILVSIVTVIRKNYTFHVLDGTAKLMISLKAKVIGHSIQLLVRLKVVRHCLLAEASMWEWK